MSEPRQRPEHLVIREFIQQLRDLKIITQEGFRDLFVAAYLEQIPPGEDVPAFDPVHRHDTVDQARRKDGANLKKIWRAIDGGTFFPLAFLAPLVSALERVKPGLGADLRQRLLHNAGLYYLPIDTSGLAPAVYAEFLQEFAEANSQLVADLNDDGRINSARTRKELLDVVEKSLAMMRELDRNRECQV